MGWAVALDEPYRRGQTSALPFVAGVLLSVCYAGLVCLAAWLHVVGFSPFIALRILLNLGWFAVAIVSLRVALRRPYLEDPRRGWIGLGTFIGVVLLFVLAPKFATGFAVYRAKILAMGERARPMIAAIKQYEVDHGVPPGNLGALVPTYLPDGIPATGIPASPQFAYRLPERGKAGTWSLWIPSPIRTFMTFDAGVFYDPSEDYGQSFERIGDWGYHHD